MPYSGLYFRRIAHRRLEMLSVRKPGATNLIVWPESTIQKPEVEIWWRPVFSDSATPSSYSTSYTLWGLSRTVMAPPGENFSISPL